MDPPAPSPHIPGRGVTRLGKRTISLLAEHIHAQHLAVYHPGTNVSWPPKSKERQNVNVPLERDLMETISEATTLMNNLHLLRLAQSKGLNNAADIAHTRSFQSLSDMTRKMGKITIPPVPAEASTPDPDMLPSNFPTKGLIYGELCSIRDTYGLNAYIYKPNAQAWLEIITSPVHLHKPMVPDITVPLGPFRIRFPLGLPFTAPGYTVSALEPNIRRGYVHPNISTGGSLCLGGNAGPVSAAMGKARYFEAATMIDDVLHNYGNDNPYINLDAWIPSISNSVNVHYHHRGMPYAWGNVLATHRGYTHAFRFSPEEGFTPR